MKNEMELRAYLRIMMRRWWIVLPGFLATFAATLVLTFAQVPMYQSTATFVLKLAPSLRDDKGFVSALDILSRRAEIAATYSEVATSRLIKQQAADELNLPPEQRRDLSVSSRSIGGTNIIEITVEGTDRVLVRDFTNAIGAKSIAYLQSLYETYQLEPLDEATLPNKPIRPSKVLNLTLAGVLGLVLGVVGAFLSEYLQSPRENVTNFSILDNEAGVYNKRFFILRLRQEMSRAKRNNYPLSVALMNVDHQGVLDGSSPQLRREALRRVTMLLGRGLREEDIMARFDDTVFAFLLPDLPQETVKESIERLRMKIALTPIEIEGSGARLNLHTTTGVVAYQDKDIEPDELLAKAMRALEDADIAAYEKVYLFAENGNRHQRNIDKVRNDE